MNHTLRIFKENFKKLLILSLMIVLPVYLIQEFVIMPSLPEDGTGLSATGSVWYLLSMWLIGLFLYVYRVAVIKLTYNALEETPAGIAELMDFSVRLWPKILWTTLLYTLSVACGMLLFVFPGMILFVAYTFYQYVSVRTGLSGRKALLLSSFYAQKNMMKAVAIAFGTVLIRSFFSYAVTSLEAVVPNAILSASIGVVLFVIVELATCLIDIYAAEYIFHTKINFDPESFKKKKSTENAQH